MAAVLWLFGLDHGWIYEDSETSDGGTDSTVEQQWIGPIHFKRKASEDIGGIPTDGSADRL